MDPKKIGSANHTDEKGLPLPPLPPAVEIADWTRHFRGENLLINFLIVLLPISILLDIMRHSSEHGVLGALPFFLIWGDSVLVAGTIREKINTQKQNGNQLKVKKEGLAIASIMCVTVGIYFQILSIVAIVCGYKALKRTQKEPDVYSGTGLAMTGILVGSLIVIINLLAIINA